MEIYVVAVEIVGDVTSKSCPGLNVNRIMFWNNRLFHDESSEVISVSGLNIDLERLQLELWLAHIAGEEVEVTELLYPHASVAVDWIEPFVNLNL